MMSDIQACPCKDYACEFHPTNHDKGCDLCVAESIKTKDMPKCFFMGIKDNMDDITDWSFKGFAELVLSTEKNEKRS